MNTEITTRHFDLSDALKDRTEARLAKLQRYFDRILDARVVVSLERNRYQAEAGITANGTPLTSHAVADTDKVALEQVLDKLEVQVRRHKDRLTRQRRKNAGSPPPEEAEPAPEEEESSPAFEDSDLDGLVGEDAGDLSVVMPVAEAAAQLRASRREVLGFTNPATGRPALLFKRRDGNLGVVDIRVG